MLEENIRSCASNDIAAYQLDGVICLRQCFSADAVEELRAAVEGSLATPAKFGGSIETNDGKGRFENRFRLREEHPTYEQYSMRGPLPALASQLLDTSRVNLFFDQYLVKEPGTSQPTAWHNDQPYWPIKGRKIVSFWIALDHVDETNGRVEFVRGSHRLGKMFQPQSFGKREKYARNEALERVPDINANRDKYDIVSWNLEPGDAIVFDGLITHGAGGNLSSGQRRRAYIIRYTGDDIVYEPRIGTSPELLYDDLVEGRPITSEHYPEVWARPK